MNHWQLTDESAAAVERELHESTDHLHMTLTKLGTFGGSWSLKGRLGAAESAYPIHNTERCKNKSSAMVTGCIIESGLLQASAVQSFSNALCLTEEPVQHLTTIYSL